MEVGTFEYACKFTTNQDCSDVKITGYNSPYPEAKMERSVDDLRFAILDQRVFDLTKFEPNCRYEAKIGCKFIERKPNVYDQLFFPLSFKKIGVVVGQRI